MTEQRRLVFVHGTFAKSAAEPGGYAMRDGETAQVLRKTYQADVYSAFKWSGGASEKARKKAGSDLALGLSKKFDGDEQVHLAGHSHGGNVIGYALQKVQPHVKIGSVRMFGTPHWDAGKNRSWNREAAKRVDGPIITYYSRRDHVQTTGAIVANAIDFGAQTSEGAYRQLSATSLDHTMVFNRDVTRHGKGADHHSSLHEPEVLENILGSNKVKQD